MAYANNITHLTQLAAATMLANAVTNGDLTTVSEVHAGIEPENKSRPNVTCECRTASIEDNYDGCWSADLIVRVESMASDTTQDQHHERAGEVFSFFFQDRDTVASTMSAAISATYPYTAQAVYPSQQSWDLISDPNTSGVFVSELRLTVKCCGSVIA